MDVESSIMALDDSNGENYSNILNAEILTMGVINTLKRIKIGAKKYIRIGRSQENISLVRVRVFLK